MSAPPIGMSGKIKLNCKMSLEMSQIQLKLMLYTVAGTKEYLIILIEFFEAAHGRLMQNRKALLPEIDRAPCSSECELRMFVLLRRVENSFRRWQWSLIKF